LTAHAIKRVLLRLCWELELFGALKNLVTIPSNAEYGRARGLMLELIGESEAFRQGWVRGSSMREQLRPQQEATGELVDRVMRQTVSSPAGLEEVCAS